MYIQAFFLSVIFAITHRIKYSGFLNYLFTYTEIFLAGGYDYVLPEQNKKVCVFDIGGNLGLYTLYLNDKYQNLDIHVFEPIPELFDSLKHNILVNKKTSNQIYLNNVGLSNKEEKVKINYFPKASALSTTQPDVETKINRIKSLIIKDKSNKESLSNTIISGIAKRYLTAKQISVTLVPISQYVTDHKISNIDIVKLDVEGCELEILQGITDQHFSKIQSFEIEIENYRKGYQSKIMNLLRKHGYEVSVKWANNSWSFVVAVKKRVKNLVVTREKQKFPFF